MIQIESDSFLKVRENTLKTILLDNRLVYVFGRHLVHDLLSYASSVAVDANTVQEVYTQLISKVATLKMHHSHFVQEVSKSIDDEADYTYYLSRLETGSSSAEIYLRSPTKYRIKNGPFVRTDIAQSVFDSIYTHTLTDTYVRADTLASIYGGTVVREVLLSTTESSIFAMEIDGGLRVTYGSDTKDLPLPFIISRRTASGSSETVIHNLVSFTAATTLLVPPSIKFTIYREHLDVVVNQGASGPLFASFASDQIRLDTGICRTGDRIRVGGSLTSVKRSRLNHAHTFTAIPLGDATITCNESSLWREMTSRLKVARIERVDSIESQVESVKNTLNNLIKNLDIYLASSTLDNTLAQTLFTLRKAHSRIDCDLAYFLLDTCRIREYVEIEPKNATYATVESDVAQEVKKAGY